jgi:hypothetical protein
MAGVLSGPVAHVVVRLAGDISGELELRDQDAAPDGAAGIGVRDVPDEEVAAPDVDVVAFVLEPLQVAAKSDWSA